VLKRFEGAKPEEIPENCKIMADERI